MERSATDRTAGIWHWPVLAAFFIRSNIGSSAGREEIHCQTVHKALDHVYMFREQFENAKEEALAKPETRRYELVRGGHLATLRFLLRHHDPQTYNREVRVSGAGVKPIAKVSAMKFGDDD